MAAWPCRAQETSPTYCGQTNLVLLPLHVGRDQYYVADSEQSDIVLLEDGRPWPFATFDHGFPFDTTLVERGKYRSLSK
jgi:hypothetical protein